ncbi:DEAD/DEAH box helicase [Paenibacillus sedimenti]|uniref:DEAD/DEAH box helicase family protein n=1 Tax=Paenibacillus sedimenti TaxID=2770274 RepID=A0A926KXQ7_9BACL|nr:helicase-related protein [Paenibacillus sedimenti]MBD0384188.1 DEAD/DEAH box helicase family protein [Paenibacillus sedimenti]
MKGQLYAVHNGSRWTWNLTIHANTDIHYWFEQYGADAGILLLEPFISLGQAVKMLQMIASTSETASWKFEQPPSMLRAKLQKIARNCDITSGVSDSFFLKTISYEMWKQGMFPGIRIKADLYKHIVKACSGRALLIEEFQQLLEYIGFGVVEPTVWLPYVQLAHLNGELKLNNGLGIVEQRHWRRGFKKETTYSCKRCGSGSERMFWAACIHCGQECPYCEECLTMGRTRFCSLLIRGRSAAAGLDKMGDYKAYIEPWGLSEAQAAASLEGLRYIGGDDPGRGTMIGKERKADQKRFLIWAVTGAGKTEMIFPFIHYTASRGGRVLIATPRKDVVLELQPRIERAFAEYNVVTLYGGSEQRWEQGQITIATTHQLLRFFEAFDLVIIDEIDAFPYHGDPMLTYAAAKAVKTCGSNILLSATPPRAVRKAAERGRLAHVRVPVRFHRNPLPVPHLLSVTSMRKCLQAKTLPQALLTRLQASVTRGAQVFVFVPNIQIVEPMVEMLRVKLISDISGNGVGIEGTTSKDPDRTGKVQRFRNREIRVLVTTTILERGVTIPKSDVFILDADSKLFDEAALVQMAGRVGRSKEDPAGLVYFAAKEITQSQKEAVRQIKQMNRIARKMGYLKGGNR